MISLDALSSQLRAVADERRLRLLRLCADGPASVSALAAASADSEPNVSRQLKQLATAGLVQRTRQGQFVEYAVADAGEEARVVRWLLERIGEGDATLRAARLALRRAREAEAARGGVGRGPLAPSRFGRALVAALLPGGESVGRLLLRCRHPELVAALAARAREVVLLAGSAAERAALRRWAESQGIPAEVAMTAGRAPRPAARAGDLVFLDEPAAARGGTIAALEADLALARRLLAPQGRAWLMVDYDALDSAAAGVAPPRRLRGLMLAAGLDCHDLVPVESEGRHVLVARSAPLRPTVPLARSA